MEEIFGNESMISLLFLLFILFDESLSGLYFFHDVVNKRVIDFLL